jgi:DNA-binding NtrC family response regulator
MLGKVLILDHLSPWSHFAAETLSAHSYDAIELGRLEEALALLEAAPLGEEYTLVIVDSLSDRTEDNRVKPLEVARIIAERFPKVLLIVASSRPTPDEAVRAYAAGASAYIPKTFDARQLTELVTQATHGGNPCG